MNHIEQMRVILLGLFSVMLLSAILSIAVYVYGPSMTEKIEYCESLGLKYYRPYRSKAVCIGYKESLK